MANSFGKLKTSIPSNELNVEQLLQIHTHFQESPLANWQEQERQQVLLAMATTKWFESHPIQLTNIVEWGQLLARHVENTEDFVTVQFAKPLADYLTYITSLPEEQLFQREKQKYLRYEAFREAVHSISSSALYDPSKIMVVIAENKMVDLDALMIHLRSMQTQQREYETHVLDNPGEFEEIPEGILMRTLLSLSFTESWHIPENNGIYHAMWDIIDENDTAMPTPVYDTTCDIVAHLTTKMSRSTYDALEYFEYKGDTLQANQIQHILGMDLSCLEFPRGLTKLLDAVYFNEYFDNTDGKALLLQMNPATHVLETHLNLYDSYEDVIANLDSMADLQGVFNFSNSMRQKSQGDALVEKIGYSPAD